MKLGMILERPLSLMAQAMEKRRAELLALSGQGKVLPVGGGGAKLRRELELRELGVDPADDQKARERSKELLKLSDKFGERVTDGVSIRTGDQKAIQAAGRRR